MKDLSLYSKTTALAAANRRHPIRTSDDLPHDHWIARQLPRGTSLRPFAEDEAISVLTGAVQDAINNAGMTRAEVARVLGTTKSYVSQVLNGSTNMTLRTFGALLWAAGRQVQGVETAPVGTAAAEEPLTIRIVAIAFSGAESHSPSFTPDSGMLALVRKFLGHNHDSPARTPPLLR